MSIIQTMLGDVGSGDYWILEFSGETVNSIQSDLSEPDSVVVDSSDNIYTVFETEEQPGTGNASTYGTLVKLSSQGQIQLQTNVDSSSVDSFRPSSNSLALDSSGNIFLGSIVRYNNDDEPYFVKLDSSGVAQNGKATIIGFISNKSQVLVRSDNLIYQVINNSTGIGNPVEPYVHLFNTSLNREDTRRINTNNNSDMDVSDCAVDSSGNLIVVGDWVFSAGQRKIYYIKYSVSGSSLNRDNDREILSAEAGKTTDILFSRGIAIDSSDNIYIVGEVTYDGTGKKALFTKINSNNNVQWARQIDNGGNVNEYMVWDQCNVDSNGNLFATSRNGSSGIRILKYNTSGVLQWVRQVDSVSTTDYFSQGGSIAFDSNDDLIISLGKANSKAYLIKIPNDGSLTGVYGDYNYSVVSGVTDAAANLTVQNSPISDSGTSPTVSTLTATSTTSNHLKSTNFI